MAKSRICACTQSSSVFNHRYCLISQTAKALTTSMSRPILTYNKESGKEYSMTLCIQIYWDSVNWNNKSGQFTMSCYSVYTIEYVWYYDSDIIVSMIVTTICIAFMALSLCSNIVNCGDIGCEQFSQTLIDIIAQTYFSLRILHMDNIYVEGVINLW